MNKRIRRVTFVAFFCALGSAMVWACGTDDQNGFSSSGTINGQGGDQCGHPNPGCSCSDVGQVADCGRVETKVGTFVTCSMGKTTCDGHTWGACIGDTIIAPKSFSGGGLHLATLGASTACVNNPCDPYCQNFVDTPPGIDASPLAANEGGLYLPSGSNSCMCNQPSNPAAEYTNIIAANKGNPASCSGNDAGTATDNCNHDYHCVGTTCQPYPVSGVNPTCTAAPDYTLGLGCSGGTTWQLQVCNRGYVPSPGLGNLVIGLNSGSPSTAPGACTTGVGASWPTGPAIAGASPNIGKCVINLASTTIGAGQCINVDVATQCTQLDGVTPLNAINSAETWAVINPTAALLAGSTPLPECDTCNNYTSLEKSAIPPLLGNAAVCANSTCGTVCGGASDGGAEGGAGCHTYVSGTVYDPGGNIPLPAVSVYEPNVALTPFTAGVSCDTCASVLPPTANLVSSTFSDLNGVFALEVNATTGIPVVFQTGRWRRKIVIGVDTPPLTACAVNNITVPADCYLPGTAVLPNAWPATNCKTRLPQTAAEGDIPLTAIVTGTREPFECSIAKFMGGAQEFGIGGGTKRMQLFADTGVSSMSTAGAVVRSGLAASVTVPQTPSGIGAGITAAAAGVATYTYLHSTTAVSVAATQSWAIGPVAAGIQTITLPAAPTAPNVITPAFAAGLGTITLWGATKPGNNGTFPITAYVSPTQIKIANAGGANEVANAAHRWRAGYGGPFLTGGPWVGGMLKVSNLTTAGNNAGNLTTTMPILSVVNAYTVTVTNAAAVANDTKNGQSSVTWSATTIPATLTIGGLTGMGAGDVGNTITFSGATNAGNNGPFTINSVTSATQVAITNGAAVTEAGPIAWVETSSGTATIPDTKTTFWNTQVAINKFDEAILPCGGNTSEVATLGSGAVGSGIGVAEQTFFYNWLKAGGRSFGNHWSARGLEIPTSSQGYAAAGWNTTATFWNGGPGIQTAPGSTLTGKVSPNAAPKVPHTNFTTWLTAQGSYAGPGVTTPQPVSGEALVPDAVNSFEWLRGSTTSIGGGSDNWGTVPAGNYSLIYSFDTAASGIVPTLQADGGAGTGCGRTIVSDMHVDTTRGSTSGTFPSTCLFANPLSDNEKAFEYLFFILSSCAIGGSPIILSAPPPPPTPPALSTATFTRDFHAVCGPGTKVVWQAFSWEAAIPAGTSIVFQGQTAADTGGAPGPYGLAVPVGTASTSTGATFFTPATTVDQDLTGATPAQSSLAWLRILMTFNPSGSTSPVLQAWNQAYDCVPAE